ncbi:MAG: hypothetical protein ACRD2P_06250, partial [Terriglobia bacterium]
MAPGVFAGRPKPVSVVSFPVIAPLSSTDIPRLRTMRTVCRNEPRRSRPKIAVAFFCLTNEKPQSFKYKTLRYIFYGLLNAAV